MQRFMMKSKIHRCTVTEANLHYEGSLTIDQDLLDAADILVNEQLHVWDVTGGYRLITYAIPAPRGSGIICVNGAGARHIHRGHVVIIATFTQLSDHEARSHQPRVVHVDEENRIKVV